MTEFGLTPHEVELIRGTLERHPDVAEAKIFGSRAMGRERPNSDIDIALWGNLDTREVLRLHAELEELPPPYLFDVRRYDEMEYRPREEHIERVGRVLYRSHPAPNSDE
ncbi:MAG TPA: nucleotidyltransferase domain-containing protein [Polyangiaceae bacterium]|nr:nucleotidyltransferase domain-containing protein [Polyangiaceae bacterium]